MQAFSSKPITGLTIDVSRAILVMLDKSIKPFNLMEILLRFEKILKKKDWQSWPKECRWR